MRKQFLRFVVAALTFACGVTANVILRTADDIPISAPEALASFRLTSLSSATPAICEIHDMVMSLECVSRERVNTRSTSASRDWRRNNLYPNSPGFPRHLTKSGCIIKKEVGIVAFICPNCRMIEADHIKRHLDW